MQDVYPSRHADVAEFLPRLDPVVHSQWREDAPVSRAQADQFDRDGFLVLEDIFSDAEVAFLQREAGKLLADRWRARWFKLGEGDRPLPKAHDTAPLSWRGTSL